MSEVKYSKEHEWIKVEGDVGTIGITQHATEMLGDIVFVELPDVGSSVEKDGNAGVVESTKAASDVYTPISGEVMENNQAIVDDPGKINSDPENEAWFFKLKIKDKLEMNSLMAMGTTGLMVPTSEPRHKPFILQVYNLNKKGVNQTRRSQIALGGCV